MRNLIKVMKQKKVTIGLLIVYLLAITWIILFKLSLPFQDLPNIRSINLIPFAGSVILNNQVYIGEIIDNIIIFIPFGIYISMLKPNWEFFKKIMPIVGVSFLFEIFQFTFAIGATDITDLIGNTLGGIIGIGSYFLVCKLFKKQTNLFTNIVASISTVLMVVVLGILVLANY